MYKLVIVDDNAYTLESFVSAFNWNEMGFSLVASFSSSSDCLAYIKRNPVDALLTDVRMPNLSGLELAKFCSENFPQIKIVITSAFNYFEYAQEAIKYNVIAYVLKPINEDSFISTMASLKAQLDRSAPQCDKKVAINPTIKQIYQFVSEHYSENINSIDVANHCLINPEYFSTYFKKHTGQNFSHYLRQFRLEKAAELLASTDLTISIIAESVGYKNLTHFYERFLEKYLMTPAEYRQDRRI